MEPLADLGVPALGAGRAAVELRGQDLGERREYADFVQVQQAATGGPRLGHDRAQLERDGFGWQTEQQRRVELTAEAADRRIDHEAVLVRLAEVAQPADAVLAHPMAGVADRDHALLAIVT